MKQISVKIDREIIELKKQNETMRTEADSGRRDHSNTYISGVSSTSNRKRTSDSFSIANSKERLRMSKDMGK